jgi:hypothetical protein
MVHFVMQSINECSIKLLLTKMFVAASKGDFINSANIDKFTLLFLGAHSRGPTYIGILPRTTTIA